MVGHLQSRRLLACVALLQIGCQPASSVLDESYWRPEPLGPKVTWETVFEQHVNRKHHNVKVDARPRTRYSHAAAVVGDEVIITLGYFYDSTDGGKATYHRDAWGLSASSTSTGKWRSIWDASSGTRGPPGKMNHAAVAHPDGGKLAIFGGTISNHEKTNDLWVLDVASGVWARINPANSAPPARNCFSAVVIQGMMYIYGGFRLSDVWTFDFQSRGWTFLSERGPKDTPEHPGIRAGHCAVAAPDGRGMYVYGGFRFENDVTDSEVFAWGKLSDLWFYESDGNRWQRLSQAEVRGGSQFFGMDLVPWRSGHAGLAVFGGTLCSPNCSLVGALDVFSLEDKKWYRVDVEEEPLHRYHHTMSFGQGHLWIFGGESFNPYMYHNAVQRLKWPPASMPPAQRAEEL